MLLAFRRNARISVYTMIISPCSTSNQFRRAELFHLALRCGGLSLRITLFFQLQPAFQASQSACEEVTLRGEVFCAFGCQNIVRLIRILLHSFFQLPDGGLTAFTLRQLFYRTKLVESVAAKHFQRASRLY